MKLETAPALRAHDFRWLLPLVLAMASLAFSAYTGYTGTDRETIQRVATTEAHQVDDRKTLDEIKLAVKETNAKVTEVLIILGTKH